LKASHESTLATLTQELGPLRKRAEDAEVSLMTAGHNERRLRAQLREAEDRGARALSDLAAELRRAESTAVEKMMASEQNAAKADETNARLARELWESRQKYDRETKALSDELDKARRRAAEAIRERGPARRPGAETSNEVVNEAVIAELQRELEAEMKTSESAAAESARREGLTRRKLASLEARVAEANSALVIATKAIDEKDASLAASTTRVKSLEASLRKLEIKALKCEDIAAVERAEKADLLDVHTDNESLEAKVKELEGELTAIRSQCEAVGAELSDARESMAFLEKEARDAAVDAEEARAGWSKAEAVAGDSNLLNAEIHRLKLELVGAGERLVERESEIERYHDSMDEFTGNDNEQQRVKHHQRVKEQRDSLKKDVAGGKARLRRAEAALLMLCTATETQRAALMRDVRARAEDLDVAGESNRRLSGWDEGEKIEGGHETGDAADESWDATVGFLAHLKLPLGL
jgi:chromosome segregation ATPase